MKVLKLSGRFGFLFRAVISVKVSSQVMALMEYSQESTLASARKFCKDLPSVYLLLKYISSQPVTVLLKTFSIRLDQETP